MYFIKKILPFSTGLGLRGLSAVVCPRAVGELAEIQSTILSNKILVASAPSALPISRVAIVFRAGSRFENYCNLGATHLLRIAAGLATKNMTGFAITRNLQQMGAGLTVTSDREIIAYTLEVMSEQLEESLCYLKQIVQPCFKPWELSDVMPRIKTQMGNIRPQIQAVELLHKAAFRNALGNSIYIPEFRLNDTLSAETLSHYVACNFTANRCAVLGVGVVQSELIEFANSLELSCTKDDSVADADADAFQESNYFGGDAREDTPGYKSHVAVAGEGASVSEPNEAMAFAILQHAVGNGSSLTHGNVYGCFGKPLNEILKCVDYSYAALNASYADAGLFGFVLSMDCEHICEAMDALVAIMKAGDVSDEDIKRGKLQLKTDLLECYSTDCKVLEQMVYQGAVSRKVESPDVLLALVDCVSEEDVRKAAKKAGSSDLSIGAVGHLGNVPYASDYAD